MVQITRSSLLKNLKIKTKFYFKNDKLANKISLLFFKNKYSSQISTRSLYFNNL